jgi:hypothetical protein
MADKNVPLPPLGRSKLIMMGRLGVLRHPLERGNRIKIASYMSYWITRERPIQLKNPSYVGPKAVKINHLFALAIIIDTLRSSDVNIHSEGLWRYNNFVELLFYSFRYRVFTAQSIELAIQALVIEKLPFE